MWNIVLWIINFPYLFTPIFHLLMGVKSLIAMFKFSHLNFHCKRGGSWPDIASKVTLVILQAIWVWQYHLTWYLTLLDNEARTEQGIKVWTFIISLMHFNNYRRSLWINQLKLMLFSFTGSFQWHHEGKPVEQIFG